MYFTNNNEKSTQIKSDFLFAGIRLTVFHYPKTRSFVNYLARNTVIFILNNTCMWNLRSMTSILDLYKVGIK